MKHVSLIIYEIFPWCDDEIYEPPRKTIFHNNTDNKFKTFNTERSENLDFVNKLNKLGLVPVNK